MIKNRKKSGDSIFIRLALFLPAILFFAIAILLPLVTVFVEAFEKGYRVYLDSIFEENARAAIRLTLITAFFSITANTIFGVLAAWLISKFEFRFKSLLITIIDIPFSVSPVISGLIFVLLFGAQGMAGSYFEAAGIQIIFAVPGIILATLFVTFPFVARELLPVMQEHGKESEEAAVLLGAGWFTLFFKVTLPQIKWGLLYGIILCNARAMGEFGAVSVVSGHIRGLTNTIPLHVEILYNEYNFAASFAVASMLAFLALLTLIAKELILYIEKNKQENI